MDAYDIFRKITRNTKFTNNKRTILKCRGNEKNNAIKSVPCEIQINIKKEITAPEENLHSSSIQLLGDISSNDKLIKRANKRKRTDIDTEKLRLSDDVKQLRNKLNIKVVGSRIPNPISMFRELPVATDLVNNLQACGYNEPTAIQMQAIPIMIAGRQLLACAPTGSGKTVAFLIPLIHALREPQKSNSGCRALILCPTRELAKQTHIECMRLAYNRQIRIKVIGKICKLHMSKSQYQCDILVSTPQRMCHLLGLDSNAISMTHVQWIVIDEADKLFEEYGTRSFRSQLKQILQACTHKERRIAMFSATYTPLVAGWCRKECRKSSAGGMVRLMVGERNTAPELVDQHLMYVGSEPGKLLAFRELMRGELEGLTLQPPVLVFVQSKERAQHLFSELIYDGISVDAVHADRTQQQRDNTVRAFREGKVWVLICTELMARGLDFKGVNLVINYDLPQSAVAYVHRVGRVGRAGRPGSALTLYTDADRATPGLLRPIAAAIQRSGCPVADHLLHGPTASTKKKRQMRISQVERDQIPSKLPLNRNTLRKRKVRNTIHHNKDDNNVFET